jgi:lipid-A-disaccharide synthase
LKYYLIAGEASGDLHGSNLIRAIKKQDPLAEFRCFGGDRMAAEGAIVVKHIRELAIMGFVEVVMKLPKVLSNLRFCRKDIKAYNPDIILFIDYPGFNLRIAQKMVDSPATKIYYISPTVWAWKTSRINLIKKFIDRLYVILPFEPGFYSRFDYRAVYLGHPLVDEIEKYQATSSRKIGLHENKNLVTLMPGSRKQEVKRILPVMIQVALSQPGYRYIVAGAPGLSAIDYEEYLTNSGIEIRWNQTYDLLIRSHAALVKSGTSTLETALFGVPQLVCYKTSRLSYLIARLFVRINYISLVNLIMNKEVVKEFVQSACDSKIIQPKFHLILNDRKEREKIQEDYKKLKELLGNSGTSDRIATDLITFCQKKHS